MPLNVTCGSGGSKVGVLGCCDNGFGVMVECASDEDAFGNGKGLIVLV